MSEAGATCLFLARAPRYFSRFLLRLLFTGMSCNEYNALVARNQAPVLSLDLSVCKECGSVFVGHEFLTNQRCRGSGDQKHDCINVSASRRAVCCGWIVCLHEVEFKSKLTYFATHMQNLQRESHARNARRFLYEHYPPPL